MAFWKKQCVLIFTRSPMSETEKVRRQRAQIKSDDEFARDYLHQLLCFIVFALWIESITIVWSERSNIEIKSDEIFLGGQSHVDTSYISLRTQSFWSLRKTLISSMISIKSKQRNAVAQIKQIRRVNGNICQHTWSIYWIEHGQHLLFETLFAVIDNDIVLQECLGVTLDFDFCTQWDSQLSLLETFIATINGKSAI